MKRIPRTIGCPTELALELLGGKWKTVILACLKDRPLRYGELRQRIPGLSDKVLTRCLVDLQERGLVVHESAPNTAAPCYGLSATAQSLRPLLLQLYAWGESQAARLGVEIRAHAQDPAPSAPAPTPATAAPPA